MKKDRFANGVVFFVRLMMLISLTVSQFVGIVTPVFAVGEKIGLVTELGGIADQGFNYLAYQGLLQAETDLGIDGTLYEPASEGDYLSTLQQCADDGNELCIAVGFMMDTPIQSAATANPGVSFAVLDSGYDSPLPSNLRRVIFNEKQAGYLAGALAGKMTTSNTIGVVGGMAIPPVIAFAEGYRNGAFCANPSARVLIDYTGTFTDPALGGTVAADMMTQGADVIFGAAGPTGNGAILYGAQNGAWSIGVDVDQYLTVFGNGAEPGSDKMLTSAMKRLDTAVFETVSDYLDAIFSSGVVQYSLDVDGVGLAPYHETDASIPQATKDYVDTVKAGILADSIDINETCRPTISGTITGDANPMGVSVRAVLKSDGSEMAQTVSNPADGSYTLTGWQGIPLDTELAVVASDENPDTDGYGAKYYDNIGATTVTDPLTWAETIVLTGSSPDRAGVDINLSTGGATVEQLMFNTRTGRLLNDVDIRRAIAYGTDRQSIFDNAWVSRGTTGEILHSLVTPGLWYKAASDDPLLTVYDFNPTTAGDILTAADWIERDTDGIRENALNEDLVLDFATTNAVSRVDSANRFKDQMANIGILVNVTTYPAGDFFSTDPAVSALAAGNFDIAEFAWVLGDDDTLLSVYNSADPQNYGGYTNVTLDGYFNAARDAKATGNPTTFQSNALLWQYLFSEDLPALPMFTRVSPPPVPSITVQPVHGWVSGGGWTVGSTVTLTVDNDADPLNGTLHFETQTVAGDGSVWFGNVESTVDLVPGQYVTLSDGATTKVLQITDVHFDSVDETTDIALGSGPADQPASVYIRTNVAEQNLNITIGSDGNWTADFSGLLEIQNIQDANIQVYDDDGDGTMAHLAIPSLDVWYMDNFINAYNWPVGTTLDLTIVNAPNPDFTASVTVGTDNTGHFDLSGLFEILPGMTVSVTGNSITRELVVSDLHVTNIDQANDTVSGTTEPNQMMWMWFGASCCRNFQADGSGNWSVDYRVPGPNGEPIADIGPGSNGTINATDIDGDNTSVNWNIPNPNFSARFPEKQVHGYQWDLGANVIISIDDPDNGVGEDYTATVPAIIAPWDPNQTFAQFMLDDFAMGLQPGQIITMTDGTITKEHTVSSLAITNVNEGTDVIAGTVEANATVDVDANCGNNGCSAFQSVTANIDGDWSADFSALGGGDIQPGSSGEARTPDSDGDTTTVQWRVPNPYIQANPGGTTNPNNWVQAFDWPLGTELTLTIDDPAIPGDIDYTELVTVAAASWDPNQTLAYFNLSGFDLQPGFVIIVNGGGVERTYSPTTLDVTDFDVNADTVSGIGTSGVELQVCVNIPNNCISRFVTPDVNGNWTVDYTGDLDLQLGDNGWAAETDLNGNQTWSDWNIPNPNMQARANADLVHGWNWPLGSTVTIDINRAGASITRTALVQIVPWGNSPHFSYSFGGEFDIQAGDVVSVTDGVTIRTITVTNLAITKVNLSADVVTGVASPGVTVQAWICDDLGCTNRHATTDGITGIWEMDFGNLGTQPDEQTTYDILPGIGIDSTESDANGNGTMYGVTIPIYTLHANLKDNEVHGHDWLPGSMITLTVDNDTDPGNGNLYTETKAVEADTTCGIPCFNLAGVFDLAIGQYVTMTDGGVTKTVRISTLAVTGTDAANDTVSGTADPLSTVSVDLHSSPGPVGLVVVTDATGHWEVDFTGLYDLNTSDFGRAIQLNPDGSDDGTLEYWNAAPVVVCYNLTLGHTGEGGDPTTTPPNSDFCAPGMFVEGEVITLNAAPSPGWEVGSWFNTDNDTSTSLTNTLTMPNYGLAVNVNYSMIEYTLTVNSVGNGSVTVNPLQATYHYGDVVELTAVADTGWTFMGWSGDLAGSSNPQAITISGNNVVTATFADITPPTVVSMVRSSANPTTAPAVNFIVTFSEPVTGVDKFDFNIITDATLSGASVTSVGGTGATRTVTVNTGTGSGTLDMDLIDNDTVKDTAGNRLGGTGLGNGNFMTGEFYTIDRTPPTVMSIVRASANPTNAAYVNFAVTFSEAVTGVDNFDFSLTPTGTMVGASVTSVGGTGATRTVTVNTGTGTGTIRLDLIDNDTIKDALINPLGGAGSGNGSYTAGQFFTIDRTPPTVMSIVRASANPTSAASVNFTVTFSEAVTGVDSFDFSVIPGGTMVGASVTSVGGTGTTRTVVVNVGTGTGTIRLDLIDNDTIKDALINPLGGAGSGNGNYTAGQFYTIDRTPPAVMSILRGSADPTNAAVVNFTVTFSEAVTGVDKFDFSITPTGTMVGASVTSVGGTGTTRTVAVNVGTGTGTIRLDLIDNDTIKDTLLNALGGSGLGNGSYTAGQFYTIDRTPPTVVSIVRASANPTNAASVVFTVTFSEAVTGVDKFDFSITPTGTMVGASIISVGGTGLTRNVTVSTGTGTGTIRLDLIDNDTIKDALLNPLGGAGSGNGNYTAGQFFTIDRTPPTVMSIVRASANPTIAVSVNFTITFSEAVTGVDKYDFSLVTTGTITGAYVYSVGGTGVTRTVTVRTGTGTGTIRLDLIDNDTIKDSLLNPLGGTGSGNGNYTVGQVYDKI